MAALATSETDAFRLRMSVKTPRRGRDVRPASYTREAQRVESVPALGVAKCACVSPRRRRRKRRFQVSAKVNLKVTKLINTQVNVVTALFRKPGVRTGKNRISQEQLEKRASAS